MFILYMNGIEKRFLYIEIIRNSINLIVDFVKAMENRKSFSSFVNRK